MQRYMEHFPAAGEIVIFDRSWYNRAGVEYVMGFCSKEQHARFLKLCPEIEKYITEGGIQLIKIWLDSCDKEQKRRFEARMTDPLRQWKLSPMDLPSRSKWFEYSRAPGPDARRHRHEARAVAQSCVPTTRNAHASIAFITSSASSPTRS